MRIFMAIGNVHDASTVQVLPEDSQVNSVDGGISKSGPPRLVADLLLCYECEFCCFRVVDCTVPMAALAKMIMKEEFHHSEEMVGSGVPGGFYYYIRPDKREEFGFALLQAAFNEVQNRLRVEPADESLTMYHGG